MPPVIGKLDASVTAPAIGGRRCSLGSGFGSAICQSAPPPSRKRSAMREDLEMRPSAKSPGTAMIQATRAHFANAIQRLKDERRYRVFIDLDRDATRFPTAVLAAERLPGTARGDPLVLKRLSRYGRSPIGLRG
jgi:hypothetical protein